jgi:AbrB family transcriptional regulator (stage V sporulation protein T)
MKATGIVRRIDDLGRVVIPKEIRRTMRIREGDPLEIYTDNDGEVIFKKYSPIGELSPFATQYAEVLSKSLSQPIIICDRDHIIAVSGISKKELLERRISHQLEEVMENRKIFIHKNFNDKKLYPIEGLEVTSSIAAPIITAGDLSGCVVLLFDDEGKLPTESDIKLVAVAANFLGKQMEE